MSCVAPDGGVLVADAVIAAQAVIAGVVSASGSPVEGSYVRLLDRHGEFAAEVRTDGGGAFRFYAADGSWTVRALLPGGRTLEAVAHAAIGTPVVLELAA